MLQALGLWLRVPHEKSKEASKPGATYKNLSPSGITDWSHTAQLQATKTPGIACLLLSACYCHWPVLNANGTWSDLINMPIIYRDWESHDSWGGKEVLAKGWWNLSTIRYLDLGPTLSGPWGLQSPAWLLSHRETILQASQHWEGVGTEIIKNSSCPCLSPKIQDPSWCKISKGERSLQKMKTS